ncbi:hypothetical protein [Nitrosopumilus maritimus]|uniref:Carboxypeptidase regulatory-like domain-containing protein n=1 Tax=Nitrosopumilus maritimus (strain SCM1) TaxID=436308 RepID=A9A2I6_NITMS|nr:hypothetical protein [Nitrosopumilus maritimus]ABX13225.1 hypothetical protein Nmar_1329 [Nitrosopumilus maritimus SCM1]
MLKITSTVLLSCMIAISMTSISWAEENFMLTISSLSEYEEGQHSIINGKTETLDGKPVSEVTIHVYFPSEIIKTSTNATGQFSVTSPLPVKVGEKDIEVYARKDNKQANSQITYNVIESKPIIIQEAKQTKPESKKPKEIDPFSKMIQELEKQKAEKIERETSIKEQQEISEKRRLAQKDLQNDLTESEKRNEVNSPRNVFYRFIQEVDSSVRGIFWQQFLFTERITQQAHEAKEMALKDGRTSFEAMKIFQNEAAVTQQEVMEFNKNLSMQYGNATESIQNMFDENGKLPRED